MLFGHYPPLFSPKLCNTSHNGALHQIYTVCTLLFGENLLDLIPIFGKNLILILDFGDHIFKLTQF